MATSFHVACEDCRCLVGLEPLETEAEADLVGGGRSFGAARLALLRDALGDDDPCVARVREFLSIHDGHDVVLGSPEDGHGTGYFEGVSRPTLAAFEAALAAGEPAGWRRAVTLAEALPAGAVCDAVVRMALGAKNVEVRLAARGLLNARREDAVVAAGQAQVLAADRARLDRLDEREIGQMLETLVALGTPAAVDEALDLLERIGTALLPRAATTLAFSGDARLVPHLERLAADPTQQVPILVALGVLVTHGAEGVASRFLPLIDEHLERGSGPGQFPALRLLPFCGEEGIARLEALRAAPPAGLHASHVEQCLATARARRARRQGP